MANQKTQQTQTPSTPDQNHKSKVAYIAHQIGNDVKGNIKLILKIVRDINLNEPDVIPFAPYMSDIFAMDDSVPTERMRGLNNDLHFLNNKLVDEVRLYGPTISRGMAGEILAAFNADIRVIAMSEGTKKDFYNKTYLNYAE